MDCTHPKTSQLQTEGYSIVCGKCGCVLKHVFTPEYMVGYDQWKLCPMSAQYTRVKRFETLLDSVVLGLENRLDFKVLTWIGDTKCIFKNTHDILRFLKKIPFIYNTDGFPFDNEILIQFIMKKLRIKEIPIPTSYTNQISNLKVIPYGLRVLKTLFLSVLQRLGVCDLRKYRLDSNIKSSKLENRIFSQI